MILIVVLAFFSFGMLTTMSAVTCYSMAACIKYAASAIAGVTFLENLFAAFLPLATQPMYTILIFQWGSSLLGIVALILSFFPLVLQIYDCTIRRGELFYITGGS
jgi:hypothetical protein